MKNLYLTLFALLLVLISGCKKTLESNDYIVLDYKLTEGMPADTSYLNSISNSSDIIFQSKDDAGAGVLSDKPQIIDLREVLAEAFRPEKFPCDLPRKVKNKLNKVRLNDSSYGYIPKDLSNFPYGFRAVKFQSATSYTNLLTSFEIQGVDDPIVPPTSLYENFIANAFQSETYSKIVYNIDCAGYFALAVSVSAKGGGVSVDSDAEYNIKQSRSMFVYHGVVRGEIYHAMFSDIERGKDSSLEARISRYKYSIDLLNSVIQRLKITYPTVDTITINEDFSILAISNSGSSSMNGEADLNINAEISPVTSSNSAGLSLKRNSDFQLFETYLIGKNKGTRVDGTQDGTPAKVSIDQISDRINYLSSKLSSLKP